MYLDEADHVGIDDQPFYYGGMLNVFKMRSKLARMDLTGGASLDKGKAAFTKVYERLRASGGGTISIYYHPNEWVQTEFWDAVNFRRGANPAARRMEAAGHAAGRRDRAGVPRLRAVHPVHQGAAGRALRHRDRADAIYEDARDDADFRPEDLLALARSVQKEITFQKLRRVCAVGGRRLRPAHGRDGGVHRAEAAAGSDVVDAARWSGAHYARRRAARDRRASAGPRSRERFAIPRTSAARRTACPTKSGLDPRACRRPTISPRWRGRVDDVDRVRQDARPR